MGRQKQAVPLQRAPSQLMHLSEESDVPQNAGSGNTDIPSTTNGNGNVSGNASAALETVAESPGLTQLVICVLGIYAAFLSWGVLQEAITTTSYPVRPATVAEPNPPTERFTYSLVLNTVQSFFAAVTGFTYLLDLNPEWPKDPIFAISSSLASPFGYASLEHIDYLTFILAKSCKLLPVMVLHLTIFRKRYPLYKYGVVMMVTLGVATFSLHHPGTSKKVAAKGQSGSSGWGIFLLSINLLLDGLTNTTQDHVFSSPKLYTRFTGPQMMVAQNVLSTVLTSAYLLIMPHLSQSGILHNLLPFPIPPSTETELFGAFSFLSRHPEALRHVLGFAACGAIGQLFIFHTLSRFSSLLLVTVTVTRKMLTMLLSVFWFGHSLSGGQWLGISLVFGGIGAEAVVQRSEKKAKERSKIEAAKKEL
ncbi:UAA transporter [Penicillium mononematosum]|uniref:UAA transporter n=1 Tax=Penicillium mononematosum TaxID=268346 RepID=UPI002549A63E|nr:UAA transporter [Penicillium mononematosum]KAJ6187582.1 UAA transporter [Penicillium mononematosum]